MIFANGNMRGLMCLAFLLETCQNSSGQSMHKSETLAFLGGMPSGKRTILEEFGIREGHLPDKYLGVLLFKVRIRRGHCASAIESIRDISSWKGKLMSFQGMVVLINHVIMGLLLHSMVIYKWPSSVTIDAAKMMRNFLGTGDPSKRLSIIVR